MLSFFFFSKHSTQLVDISVESIIIILTEEILEIVHSICFKTENMRLIQRESHNSKTNQLVSTFKSNSLGEKLTSLGENVDICFH